uniref:Uncharacterized protein n=1 Tax=Avena sativa TaxID=4498 RepID=A0ACD5VYG7_AVESA
MVEMGRASCSVPLVLLLAFLSCLFLAHAAAAGGNRKMLLSGVGDPAAGGAQEVPTTPDREAAGTDPTLVLADDEEMVVARRVDLQTEDYPGSGANGRHDPRNPH